MFYEIATLDLRLWGAKKSLEGISIFAASSESKGKLLGSWEVEVGELRHLILLRSFDTLAELGSDRKMTLRSANPFNAGDSLTGFKVESFAPFPFFPTIQAGVYGSVYEFRDYQLAVGGIDPTIAAWAEALPARQPISPVLIAMYALDGSPRMLHIVPYDGMDARTALRKEIYFKGIWPPKGAPEQIVKAISTIAIPTSISNLK